MPETKKKLILIDTNALMHRAYHALPPLTDKKGQVVNAVYGFTSILLKILKELKPDYIACAFDMAAPTFRHEEFKEYKAHRPKAPEEFYTQIPKIQEIISAFGIPIYQKEGFEADDVIGTAAHEAPKIFKSAPYEIVVLTGDLDTLQLVNHNVKVYTFKKGISDIVIYGEEAVKERYGLAPSQMVDYKGLRGDPSDNIPGVPGVGEKTAVALLKDFGSIDGIYADFEKTKAKIKPALAKKLEEFKDHAYFSRRLASIRLDAPISFDLAKSEFKGYDREKIMKLFQELNFFSLISRLNNGQAAAAPGEKEISAEEAGTLPGLAETGKTVAAVNAREIDELASEIKKQSVFAFDIKYEFKDFNYRLTGLGIAAGGKSWEIGLIGRANEELGKLKNIFEDPAIAKIGHDLKTSTKVLRSSGITFSFSGRDFDTMIGAYLLAPGKRDYALEKIAFEHLGAENISQSAAGRARIILNLEEKLLSELKKQNMLALAREIEMPLVEVLAKMETAGVKIDAERLQNMALKIEEKIDKIKKEIFKMAGGEFNVNSTRELAVVLFEKLGIPTAGVKRTKTSYSTAADVLEQIKSLHPIVNLIIQYRELAKIKSTYADALPKLINPETERIHTTFNQVLTATGRLSSSDPNLQNIPVKTEIGNEIRMAFIPKEPDWRLLSFDYSQIELRIIASMANDQKMLGIFSAGGDIHRETAAEIQGVAPEQVTEKMRNAAKALNFGIIYGMSAHGFSQATGLAREEAQDFIDRYLAKFFDVSRFIGEAKETAQKKGYAETIFGRRRWLPELSSPNFQIKSAAERMAINMPIQGTAADIIKLAMIAVHKKYKNDPDINLLLQVHDELVFEARQEKIGTYAEEIKDIMENVYFLKAPLRVSVFQGENWGEMSEVKSLSSF